MKRFTKKYWGIIPISAFALWDVFVITYQTIASVTLRNIPTGITFWGTFFSFFLLFIWLFWFLYKFAANGKSKIFYVLYTLMCIVVGLTTFIALFSSGFFSLLVYETEYIVEHDGIKMVACDDNSGYGVDYYQYHNFLFRDSRRH